MIRWLGGVGLTLGIGLAIKRLCVQLSVGSLSSGCCLDALLSADK